MKTISVIVYNWNRRYELLRTLRGLSKQMGISEVFELEVIVIDNASADGSVPALEQLVAQEKGDFFVRNLKLLCSDERMLKSAAIQSAMEASSGEYLAFAESSIIWTSDKLLQQYQILEQMGEAVVYGTGELLCRGKSILYPPAEWSDYKKKGNIFPDLLLQESILLETVLFPKNLYQEVGGLDENLPVLAEYELLLRLSKKYPFVYVPEKIAQRKTEEGYGEKTQEILAAQCYIMGEFAEDLLGMGLKEEKFEQVLQYAEEKQENVLLAEYMNILAEDAEYSVYWKRYLEKKNPRHRVFPSRTGDVSGVSRCVGCGACVSACPMDAIQMVSNEEGFLYPEIAAEKCIHCKKCLAVCPCQREIWSEDCGQEECEGLVMPALQENCFALMATDEVRKNSSSGGIFPLLADAILMQGGYVAGAVYDEKFHVKHIVSNWAEDVEAMRSSKYVQSDMGRIYAEIKQILQRGKAVLFSGTACQAAGLRSFLGRDYDGLYVVDVVCHGVPSPGIFEQYIQDLQKRNGKILKINFREKEKFGWKTGLYIKFQNNSEYVEIGRDIYFVGFLQSWFLRKSCYQCDFKDRAYSDITLGDFWGIGQLCMELKNGKELDDGKGTSYMTLNTAKGEALYHRIESSIQKKEPFLVKQAARYNPCIKVTPMETPFRSKLFSKMQGFHLRKAVNEAASEMHFDVGLVLWWSGNYGNALTNYALYREISKRGSVLAIDSGKLHPGGYFGEFARENYQLSSQYFPGFHLSVVQDSCDTLLVGSDQTWNQAFSKQFGLGNYYWLDFVSPEKRKVSYAASFGMKEAAPRGEEYTALYQQFHNISVREGFGVEVCREEYGVEAAHVLDPVFLLEAEEYDALIEKNEQNTAIARAAVEKGEPFICAYILNPTVEKRKVCKKIQEMLGGIKIINMSENSPTTRDMYRHILEFDHVQGDLRVEDWLYFMRNCQYVITDSFHGTCFSVIFRKPFVAFVNRQPGRFEVFQKFSGLPERIFRDYEKISYEELLHEPDWDEIYKIIKAERKRSVEWLEKALGLMD